MKGYYKKPAETAEAFEDGWFKTGDIGKIDEDGFLVITDRKKDLIVTAGGKNVAPQPIENILKTNPYISNIVVIGDRRRFISALVVPNFEKLEAWAREARVPAASRAELVRDPRVVALVQSEIDRITSQFSPPTRGSRRSGCWSGTSRSGRGRSRLRSRSGARSSRRNTRPSSTPSTRRMLPKRPVPDIF